MTAKAKPQVPASLQGLAVPVADLVPFGKNPRKGCSAAIVESLETHGQYRPIVVRKGTNEVLAGNHTLAAAVELGWEQIAATFVECDDDEAARIVLVDNRTNDLAEYDDHALVELLQSLPDFDGTGWNQDDLVELLNGLDKASDEDWDNAFGKLPDGEPDYVTRTFSLSREQAEVVDAATDAAIEAQGKVDGNKNGYALALMAEVYLGQR